MGVTYANGDNGVRAEPNRAIALYEKACKITDKDSKAKGSAKSCYILAADYANGENVAIDRAKASHYYQIACDLDNDSACFHIANAYLIGDGVDENIANGYYQRDCQLYNANKDDKDKISDDNNASINKAMGFFDTNDAPKSCKKPICSISEVATKTLPVLVVDW